jgi:integration host factor subunit beta
MVNGKRTEIRGFGSFQINYCPARTGRNPRIGEKVPAPENFDTHFKAGRELREQVDS